MMKHAIILILVFLVLGILGCKSYIRIDKRPSVAYPILDLHTHQTNDWVVVDQGYCIEYSRWGMNAYIDELSATFMTNKTIQFNLGGYHSNVLTNEFHVKLDNIFNTLMKMREQTQ